MLHNPVEELGVDMFGQSITGIRGLQTREGLDIRLCGRLQLPVAQPLGHILVGHAHQLAKRHQVTVVGLHQKEEVFISTIQHKSDPSMMWLHITDGYDVGQLNASLGRNKWGEKWLLLKNSKTKEQIDPSGINPNN